MAGIGLAGPEAVVDPSSLLTDGAQLIGGQWVPAAGGETIDVINPATGEVLLRVPRSGPADVDAAARAAIEAFPAWAVRLARRIQAGQVTINGFGSRGVIGAPWGGYKHSGFGRTMSAESVLDYTQIKTVVINA